MRPGDKWRDEITKETAKELWMGLSEFRSARPNELHPRVLKELRDAILEPLMMMCMKSLERGKVPED